MTVRRIIIDHVLFVVADIDASRTLYTAALAGEIPDFTGVSAPYEAPADPELRLDTTGHTPPESAAEVIVRLEELDLVPTEVS